MAHLTPQKLLGSNFSKDSFEDCKIALMAYCPPPPFLLDFALKESKNQYFIHLSPKSVHTFSHQGIDFLSLQHVYGGPVSASTVEELAYYGIEYILAFGLAGGLGTKSLKLGDFYMIDHAISFDGTSSHYSSDKKFSCSPIYSQLIFEHWNVGEPLSGVTAATGDAIYREDELYLQNALDHDCDIVNLDTSHLYAAAVNNHEGKKIHAVECGVLSDACVDIKNWESKLEIMMFEGSEASLNPLEETGKIVKFYTEMLAPLLLEKRYETQSIFS